MPESKITERFTSYLYYPILGAAVLFYMFARKYWLGCMKKIKDSLISETPDRLPTIFSRISQPNRNLDSYSMH